MLEQKGVQAVDLIFRLVCDFIDQVTGYARPPKISRNHNICSAAKSRTMPCSFRQLWTGS